MQIILIMKHPKIKQFPMGRDWRGIKHYNLKYKSSKKSILCLCSFQICRAKRQYIYNAIKDKKWMTFNTHNKHSGRK